MRTACAAFLVVLATIVRPAADASLAGSQPFLLDERGGVVVTVRVNGQGPFRFLVDTGSSRSVVSDALAARLGLHAVASTRLVTPAGEAHRPVVGAHLEVTAGVHAPVLATVVQRRHLVRGQGTDGLIGQDVLASRVYTIDYRRRRLTWHRPPDASPVGVRLALEFDDGRPLVSLPQAAATALALVPDSGAGTIVLFERPGRVLPVLTPLEIAGVRTASGQLPVRRVRLDELRIGVVRLRDQEAVLVPRSAVDAFGDGLLPLHLFDRVTVNGPERYLAVERRAAR